MQARRNKAVILTLGMLLKRVDISLLIDYMTTQARMTNPHFEMTPALMQKAFMLSTQFNLDQLDKPTFFKGITELLAINLTEVEFWRGWNLMVEIGDLKMRTQLLLQTGKAYSTLFYLHSDTNVAHMEMLEAKGYKIPKPEAGGKPTTFEGLPLYASCHLKKRGLALIQQIVSDIRSQTVNPMETITVVLGNPENIEDANLQKFAKQAYTETEKWCVENNVKVLMHDYSLQDTLLKLNVDEMLESIARLNK